MLGTCGYSHVHALQLQEASVKTVSVLAAKVHGVSLPGSGPRNSFSNCLSECCTRKTSYGEAPAPCKFPAAEPAC